MIPSIVNLIIPYRDNHPEQRRAEQLAEFIPYMKEYLKDVPHRFYVIEQSEDGKLFNRGALLNYGFKLATEMSAQSVNDAFIFHDVDLLPDSDLKEWYTVPPKQVVYHIAAVKGNRYLSDKGGLGGIVNFRMEDYQATNGHPNNFGWGDEDNELRRRVNDCRLTITRPNKGSITDLENLTLSEKLTYLKTNELKNPFRKEGKITHISTWHKNGLNSMVGRIVSIEMDENVIHQNIEIM